MRFDDRLADTRVQHDTTAGAASAGVDAVEALEDVRHMLRGNARLLVGHPEPHRIAIPTAGCEDWITVPARARDN